MIVNGGAIALLQAQQTFLAACQWALFVNNVPDGPTNTLASYTEAAWAGYARVVVGAFPTPVIVGPRAQMSPNTQPSFSNASGVNQSFFGWMLLDSTGLILIAATNVGLTVLPNGLVYNVNQTFTDKNE